MGSIKVQTIIKSDTNSNLQSDLLELNRLEKELAKRRIMIFSQRYLPHYCSKPFANFHLDLFNIFESNSINKRIAIASPRGSGKSVITCLIYPLWAICTKRKKNIVILSSSSSLAEEWLAGIIKEIEGNEKLRQDFGDLVGTEKWTDSQIITSTGIKVVAKGAGSAIRGARSFETRPDLIEVDDLCDEFNSATKCLRDKLKEWWDRSIMQLPGAYPCDIFQIGTIYHGEDLLSKNIEKWNGRVYDLVSDTNESLWPEMFSLDWINKKREESELAFLAEYQNKPITYQDVKIRREQLGFYDIDNIKHSPVKLYFGIDPSQSKKNHSDYNACTCIAKVQNDENIYVVDVMAKRIGYRELIEDLFLFVEKCTNLFTNAIVDKLVFEDNAFQYIIREEFERIMKERNQFLPTQGIKHNINKTYRYARMCPQLESQTILFRNTEQQNRLINEIITFPNGSYDDMWDSLENVVSYLNQKSKNRVSVDVVTNKNDDTYDDNEIDEQYKPNEYGQLVRSICTGR